MIKKMKSWLGIVFFASLVLGGLIAPLFTPNYGVYTAGSSLYMPAPYL